MVFYINFVLNQEDILVKRKAYKWILMFLGIELGFDVESNICVAGKLNHLEDIISTPVMSCHMYECHKLELIIY